MESMTQARWWEQFVDAWGQNPGEYFVVSTDRVTGMCGLSNSPAGAEIKQVHQALLEAPFGEKLDQYFTGSLVRGPR